MAAAAKKNANAAKPATKKNAPSGAKKSTAPQKTGGAAGRAGELIGLALICFALVSLVVLITADEMTNPIKALIRGLAGSVSYAVPALLIWIGALTLFSRSRKKDFTRIALIAFLALGSFALVHVFSADAVAAELYVMDYFNFIAQSFGARAGAGALGALLCYPLYAIAGKWGALIMLVFLVAADVLLLKNISIARLRDGASERIRQGRERYLEHAREREERRALAEAEEPIWDEPEAPAKPRGRRRKDEEEFAPAAPIKRGAALAVPEYFKKGPKRVLGAELAEREDEEEDARGGVAAPFAEPKRNAGRRSPFKVDKVDSDAEPEFEDDPFAEPVAPPAADEGDEAKAGKYEAKAGEYDAPAGEYDAPADEYDATADEYEAPAATDVGGALKHEFKALPEARPAWRFGGERDEEAADIPGAEDEETLVEELEPEPFGFAEDDDLPPFELEQPEKRERVRKVLGEPVERPASEGRVIPSQRIDGTPLVMPQRPRAEATKAELPEYNYPPMELLKPSQAATERPNEGRDQDKAQKLEETLKSFGIAVRLVGIAHGPAVTRFELSPAPGVKVSRITSLSDDIALNLAATSVRIEAPIPGKAAVGVEIPNDVIETVPLRDVLESADARKHPSRLAVALGKDNGGRYIVADLAKMPHVLIAGQTGSGKSVCINCFICSILCRARPDEVRLIMIDPKVVELSVYNGTPHLLVPVVTDPKKAAGALTWAVVEMTERYKRFAEKGVRDMKGYNLACGPDETPMPQIVIIIDELADLMMVAPGEVEDAICRLAQLARAAGIHLVIATQRPSVNVITGVIKANIPSRIAFTVASYVDSRTILDFGGAEKLLGRGDMLFAPSGTNKPHRVQGAWVSDDEVKAVVDYIKDRHDVEYSEDVIEHLKSISGDEEEEDDREADPLMAQAVQLALEAGQISTSMIQRRMRVGYARAGRMLDDMTVRGYVSPAEGSKPRNVLITREQYREIFGE